MALSPVLGSGSVVPEPVELAASGEITPDQAAAMTAAAEESASDYQTSGNFVYSDDNWLSKALRQLGIASVDYQQEYNTWSADRANQFAADQSARANEFTRSERLASQQFNAEQAQLQRDFESASARDAMDFNADQAEIARRWSREMRQTAYQDTVNDLKAAGLNPILAYSQGPTSAGSAGTASASGIPSGSSAYSASSGGFASSSRSPASVVVRSLSSSFQSLLSSAVSLYAMSRLRR